MTATDSPGQDHSYTAVVLYSFGRAGKKPSGLFRADSFGLDDDNTKSDFAKV